MSDNDSEEDYAASHAAAIKRLKTQDPEFYEYLRENDRELLNFKDSEGQISEQDEKDEESSTQKLSASKLAYIKLQIKKSPTIKICKNLIGAFKIAVQQTDSFSTKTDMANSELFNDIMKICLVDLVPALHVVLKLPDGGKMDPSKSKLWKKLTSAVKSYLVDLLKLLSVMKDPSILTLLLKHVVHLLPFYAKFIKLCRLLLKKMISLWCSNEETVRVLSLIVIVRAMKSLPREYMGQILKHMYFAYVRNTKFTSQTSWPMINFMKKSLTEVYALYPDIAYEHAFVYIRQLAIHLRNAITTKKKEAYQTVYNWQYVHCLLLWCHMLCRLQSHDALKSLIYPLVQTVIGTINLIPTAKYVPLRFHLIKALTNISEETETFVPILPLILDVLTITDYNKKSSFSVKPVDFSCSLKVTKSQLIEAGFKDGCILEVCTLMSSYLKMYSHCLGFPELALPSVLQIKNFAKHCKISKYNQQLKSVLGKIEENTFFISEKRRAITFKITDSEEIKKWEQNIKNLGTPFMLIDKETKTNVSRPKKKQKVK